MDNNSAHSAAAQGVASDVRGLQKPKSRLLTFRDRLLSPHLKEYRPHAAESLHQQRQVTALCSRPHSPVTDRVGERR